MHWELAARTVLFPIAAMSAVMAQTEKTTLRGTVADPSGAIVPGTEITVTEIATNIEARKISSDASGRYSSPAFSGPEPSNTNTSGGLPDRIADSNLSSGRRTRDRCFDPSAFAVPKPGRFGNSAANVLLGHAIDVHHLSTSKRLPPAVLQL